MTTPPAHPNFPMTQPAGDDRPTGPIPVIGPPASGPGQPRSNRPWTPILLVVIGVLSIALIVMTALWITTNTRLAAIESDRVAVPNLIEVAERHLGGTALVSGDAESVSVTVYATTPAGLAGMLDELGFSSAVLDRIGNTRALDGTLSAQGKNCNVTWTYHPDHGLQMVFEAVPPS